MATLLVSRIGFEGRHGATAPERLTTRKFEVDVEIDAPLDLAEGSDRLSDTIDFRDIAEVVVSNGTGGPSDSTMFYSLYLYQRGFGEFEMGYAAAMAWLLVVIVGAATAINFFASKYWVFYDD